MRVGLVIYGSLNTLSGGYLYDRHLVSALRRWGDQVDIISLPWRSYARHLTDNGSRALLRRMNEGYDVLLQDELNHPSLAWANSRLDSNHPPIIAIVHHLRSCEDHALWANPFYRWVERRYLRSVDGFIYNSQTTRREVERLLGRERLHLVAYPAGDRLISASTSRVASQKLGVGPLRLLFVGNLIPRKGLHVLLDALARVRGNWRLRVVGRPTVDPTYTQRVQRAAEEAGLADRVIWLGELDDAALAAEMALAHVLAVPSHYEGFGIVYLEGMAFGLPSLATTGGAAKEIITDGENGYLVNPGDATALAERIEALAGDRALLARLSEAALARYAGHPTWDETTTIIRDFLLRTAHRGKD